MRVLNASKNKKERKLEKIKFGSIKIGVHKVGFNAVYQQERQGFRACAKTGWWTTINMEGNGPCLMESVETHRRFWGGAELIYILVSKYSTYSKSTVYLNIPVYLNRVSFETFVACYYILYTRTNFGWFLLLTFSSIYFFINYYSFLFYNVEPQRQQFCLTVLICFEINNYGGNLPLIKSLRMAPFALLSCILYNFSVHCAVIPTTCTKSLPCVLCVIKYS